MRHAALLDASRQIACSGRRSLTLGLYSYTGFSPVLHYNAPQGDFAGGAFGDMRAAGQRLNSL
jgi:hypothetical protein